jgi:hypothetical protein
MPAPGRNDPCHCGEDKKYKHCCLSLDAAMPPAPDAHRSRTPENSNRPPVTSWLATEANRAFDPFARPTRVQVFAADDGVRAHMDSSMTLGSLNPHIIKGRPFGVGFECLAQFPTRKIVLSPAESVVTVLVRVTNC